MPTTYILTADVGGTNSRMSLYAVDQKEALCVKYYRNATTVAEHVDESNAFGKYIVGPFLEYCWNEYKLAPISDTSIVACLATAGVVSNNRVNMTNLNNLLVDGSALENCRDHKYLKQIQICRLINDFVAQGYGCLTLQPGEVQHLSGPNVPPASLTNGPKVCVGAGTGLGVCYLTNGSSGNYDCWPSEGGHVDYAPRNKLESKLWEYLRVKFRSRNRISVERVVSGKGLANVYEFMAHEFGNRVNPLIDAEFRDAGDEQGKVVAVNVENDDLCRQAMEIMMAAYGSHVGSAAISFVPTGGLFVTGGLTPKNMHHIEPSGSEFMLAYRNKGRVAPILDNIPMYAVLVEDLGVRGAYHAALQLAKEEESKGAGSRSTWGYAAVLAAAAVGSLVILSNRK